MVFTFHLIIQAGSHPAPSATACGSFFEFVSLLVVIANLFYRFRHAKNSAQQEQMVWVLASISLAALYILSGKLLRQFYSSVGPMDVLT